MTKKCNSCVKGLNGRYGNGYQPCSCPKKPKLILPPKVKDDCTIQSDKRIPFPDLSVVALIALLVGVVIGAIL